MVSDEDLGVHHVEAAFRFGGLLLRAGVYAFVYAIADRYDCGRALLTGLLLGDLLGHLLSLAWQWRDGLVQVLAELGLLAIVFLFVRSQMVWPDELPLRAILGLAAFGVFASKIGGSLLTHLGPSERGLA